MRTHAKWARADRPPSTCMRNYVDGLCTKGALLQGKLHGRGADDGEYPCPATTQGPRSTRCVLPADCGVDPLASRHGDQDRYNPVLQDLLATTCVYRKPGHRMRDLSLDSQVLMLRKIQQGLEGEHPCFTMLFAARSKPVSPMPDAWRLTSRRQYGTDANHYVKARLHPFALHEL